MFGFLGFWMFGLLGFWIFGCLDFWIIGCFVFWIIGFLGASLSKETTEFQKTKKPKNENMFGFLMAKNEDRWKDEVLSFQTVKKSLKTVPMAPRYGSILPSLFFDQKTKKHKKPKNGA